MTHIATVLWGRALVSYAHACTAVCTSSALAGTSPPAHVTSPQPELPAMSDDGSGYRGEGRKGGREGKRRMRSARQIDVEGGKEDGRKGRKEGGKKATAASIELWQRWCAVRRGGRAMARRVGGRNRREAGIERREGGCGTKRVEEEGRSCVSAPLPHISPSSPRVSSPACPPFTRLASSSTPHPPSPVVNPRLSSSSAYPSPLEAPALR